MRPSSKCPHSDRNMWPGPPWVGDRALVSVAAVFQKRFRVEPNRRAAAATSLSAYYMAYSQATLQAMSCTVMILYRLLGFQTSGTMDPFFTLIRT